MANDIINGHNLRISIGDKYVYAATTCEVSISGESRELAHKDVSVGTGAGWSGADYGTKTWEASTDCLYAEAVEVSHEDFQGLFTAFNANTKLTFEFSDSVIGHTQFTGTAIITSINLNAPNNEEATATVSFRGDGALVMATIT